MARNRKTDRTPHWERLLKLVEISEQYEQQNSQTEWPMGVKASDWEVACFLSARIGGALVKADGDWAKAQAEITRYVLSPRFQRLIRRNRG